MKDCDIHLDIMKYKNIKIPINPVLLLVINFFLTKVFYKMPASNRLAETQTKSTGYRGADVKLDMIKPQQQVECKTMEDVFKRQHGSIVLWVEAIYPPECHSLCGSG